MLDNLKTFELAQDKTRTHRNDMTVLDCCPHRSLFARIAATARTDRTAAGRRATANHQQAADGDRTAIIRCEAVTKGYRLGKGNDVAALRGASLEIGAGEMVAIVGPSGSGKSTLMHILGCLDTPDAGVVEIAGTRVDSLGARELTQVRSRTVGFIFQGFNLIPTLSALDNVALAAEYAGAPRPEALERARELLAMVGLGERMGHVPSELSGGQQQRVAIARALVNRPALVLGDEPTGDLDTATSDEIVALMRKLNAETGTTFVIVTHNPEVAEACDRTIRMRDGSVESLGYETELSVDEVLETAFAEPCCAEPLPGAYCPTLRPSPACC